MEYILFCSLLTILPSPKNKAKLNIVVDKHNKTVTLTVMSGGPKIRQLQEPIGKGPAPGPLRGCSSRSHRRCLALPTLILLCSISLWGLWFSPPRPVAGYCEMQVLTLSSYLSALCHVQNQIFTAVFLQRAQLIIFKALISTQRTGP